jgi:DNA-directed RNA polymerase specialized sigma24 family protein
MSTDDDFSAYVGTHWSMLVRAALLLGCAPDRAEAVVQAALVGSYQHWAQVWQDDRADVDVLTQLLDGVYAPLGRTWRGENATDTAGPGSEPDHHDAPGDETDDVDTSGLARALVPLGSLHRDVLVLRYVAELDDMQTADVLDVRPATVQERLARALAEVEPARLRDESR